MWLRLALMTCMIFSTSCVTTKERTTSPNSTISGEETTTQTVLTSTGGDDSQTETWEAVTAGTQQVGLLHTTSKPIIQNETTTQEATHSKEPMVQRVSAVAREVPADNTLQTEMVPTLITTEHENNTSIVQTTVSITPGDSVWLVALEKTQLVLSITGFLANTVTVITLTRNGDMFQPAICLLLKHQAVFDALVCAMGSALLLEPPLWTTGNDIFDAAVCHLWHGQGLFWGAILISVWTLVSIAIERYMAVCHPFRHAYDQGQIAYKCIAAMHVANLIIIFPSFLEVRFKNGVCLSELLIEGDVGEELFYAFSLMWFFEVYLLPVIAYVYLYGRVILVLYRRKKSKIFSSCKVTESAQSIITKTAITVTVIFVFAIGFDAWAYVLGYTGVVEYEYGSAKQKVGVFFSVFNSIVNPFVYLVLMKPIRVSLRKTFSFCVKENVKTDSTTKPNESSGTVTSTRI